MKNKGILLVFFIVIAIVAVIVVGRSIGLFALDPNGGGGGGGERTPSTEYDIGAPVLNPISPDVDYDSSVRLTWSLTSPYTITNFEVWMKYESDSWILMHNLGNVHQVTTDCYRVGNYQYKVIAKVSISGCSYYSQYSTVQLVRVVNQAKNIPVLKIIESPNTNGNVNLDWNAVTGYLNGIVSGYKIYRYFSGTWQNIDSTISSKTDYIDYISENGTYKYYITSVTIVFNLIESDPSNIQSVEVALPPETIPVEPEDLPLNPSIIINSGAENTSSFDIILTLYCENAKQMKFQLTDTIWTDWVPYATTYATTLFADNPHSDYRIGVVFRNDAGESIEVFDDIIYELEEEEEEPPIPPVTSDKTDYTMVYILVPILVVVIGIIIFIEIRKRNKRTNKELK